MQVSDKINAPAPGGVSFSRICICRGKGLTLRSETGRTAFMISWDSDFRKEGKSRWINLAACNHPKKC